MTKDNKQDQETNLENQQIQYLKRIDKSLSRLTSFKWNFLLGLIKGFATVLGATIVTTIVFAILAQILLTANGLPGFDQLIETSGIDTVIEEQVN